MMRAGPYASASWISRPIGLVQPQKHRRPPAAQDSIPDDTPVWWPEPVRRAACRQRLTRKVYVRLLVSKWAHTSGLIEPLLVALQKAADAGRADSYMSSGQLEIKQFIIPGWDSTGGTRRQYPGHTRVNHTKYIVTDRRINIGTSNMTWDYFASTAGQQLQRRSPDAGPHAAGRIRSRLGVELRLAPYLIGMLSAAIEEKMATRKNASPKRPSASPTAGSTDAAGQIPAGLRGRSEHGQERRTNRSPCRFPGSRSHPARPAARSRVIDYDAANKCYYPPVDLDDPLLLANDGLDPSEADPRFHQQMVYAIASRTIHDVRGGAGARDSLAPRRSLRRFAGRERHAEKGRHPVLKLYPHAMQQANAYYSPQAHGILFGFFRPTRPARAATFPASSSSPASRRTSSLTK